MNNDLIVHLAEQLFLRYPYDNPQKLLTLAEEWLRAVAAWREVKGSISVDFVSNEIKENV